MAAYLIILTLFRTYKIVGDKVLLNMHICIHHVSLTSYKIYGTFKHNTDFFQISKIKLCTALARTIRLAELTPIPGTRRSV